MPLLPAPVGRAREIQPGKSTVYSWQRGDPAGGTVSQKVEQDVTIGSDAMPRLAVPQQDRRTADRFSRVRCETTIGSRGGIVLNRYSSLQINV